MVGSNGTVVIMAGGERLVSDVLADVPDPDFVIAADSGLDEALRLGIPVDLVVGDLDSVSDHAVDAARAAGVEFAIHPEDKDQTDLELALTEASRRRPARLVVVGGGGGRVDHLLANVGLIANSTISETDLWVTNDATTYVVREAADVVGDPGGIVTLLAIGEAATGVTTVGLAWELEGERLEVGTSRGVSNRFETATARIAIERGTLLAIVPRNLEVPAP